MFTLSKVDVKFFLFFMPTIIEIKERIRAINNEKSVYDKSILEKTLKLNFKKKEELLQILSGLIKGNPVLLFDRKTRRVSKQKVVRNLVAIVDPEVSTPQIQTPQNQSKLVNAIKFLQADNSLKSDPVLLLSAVTLLETNENVLEIFLTIDHSIRTEWIKLKLIKEGKSTPKPACPEPKQDIDLVKLCLVSTDRSELWFKMKKSTPFLKLFEAYCARKDITWVVSPQPILFFFDDRRVDQLNTPSDYDLKDNDRVDVMVR